MLHILPRGFHHIRHYGLFASAPRAANIVRLRELLGSAPPPETTASPNQDEPAEKPLPPCPCRGGRMIVIEVFERGMQPGYRPPPHKLLNLRFRRVCIPLQQTETSASPLVPWEAWRPFLI